MEIKLNLNKEDIEYIEEISLGMSVESYLESYLKHNLFRKSLDDNLKDKFSILMEKIKYYRINQKDIAYFYGTTQSTVSRFIQTQSKNSFLYTEILLNYKEVEEFIFDVFFLVKSRKFNSIFCDKEIMWLNSIIEDRTDLFNFYYALVFELYSTLTHGDYSLQYKIEIPSYIKDRLVCYIKRINKDINEKSFLNKDVALIDKFYQYEISLTGPNPHFISMNYNAAKKTRQK